MAEERNSQPPRDDAETDGTDNSQSSGPVEPEQPEAADASATRNAPDAGKTPPKSGRGLAALALFIALLAAGGVGYQAWLDYREAGRSAESTDWSQQIDSRVARARSALEASLSELESSLSELRRSLAQAESQLQQRVDGFQADASDAQAEAEAASRAADRVEQSLREELRALERRFQVIEKNVAQLAGERRDEDDRLLVAEAEFLMRLANERLRLFEDPEGSLEALKLARVQLQAVDDPLFASVRQTLTTEIESLEQFEMPDRAEISGQLLHLAETSTDWPLDDRRTLDSEGANLLEPDTEETGWWARARKVLSEVAVVHRDTGDATVMLTLKEERLLRQNIRLQLQIAQLAAIRGDQAIYDNALDAVERWVREYHALDSQPVKAALERIQALRSMDIDPQLPTVDSALRELRSLRASAQMAEGET